MLDSKPGEYVAIGRRKGNDWYIGAINNHTARTISPKLDFLPDGNYTAEIWSDAPASDTNLNHLVKVVKNVNKQTVMDMALAAGGGQVMHLYPTAK